MALALVRVPLRGDRCGVGGVGLFVSGFLAAPIARFGSFAGLVRGVWYGVVV